MAQEGGVASAVTVMFAFWTMVLTIFLIFIDVFGMTSIMFGQFLKFILTGY